MSARALEFVETWVSEKIDAMDISAAGDASQAAQGDDSQAKLLTAQCLKAAQDEGIPASEINEAFDDLTAFIAGEIEEAKERNSAHAAEEDEDDVSLIAKDDARLVDEDDGGGSGRES